MWNFADYVQFYWLISTLLHCLFNNFGFTLGKPQSERKISVASSFRSVPVQLWTFCTNNRQSKKWRNAVSSLARIWKIPHLYPGWSRSSYWVHEWFICHKDSGEPMPRFICYIFWIFGQGGVERKKKNK